MLQVHPPKTHGRQALIVSRDREHREATRRSLSRLGFVVDDSWDLPAATHKLLRQGSFDVVICDEVLPSGCALDLFRTLIARGMQPAFVIALDAEWPNYFAARSNIAFVTKPLRRVELQRALACALRQTALPDRFAVPRDCAQHAGIGLNATVEALQSA